MTKSNPGKINPEKIIILKKKMAPKSKSVIRKAVTRSDKNKTKLRPKVKSLPKQTTKKKKVDTYHSINGVQSADLDLKKFKADLLKEVSKLVADSKSSESSSEEGQSKSETVQK